MFEVRLPWCPPGASAAPAPSAPSLASAPGKRHRVLLVDDNDDAATMLAAVLTRSGYDVQVAYDPPTALDIALSFQPDFAILDIGLPVMDGYQLA